MATPMADRAAQLMASPQLALGSLAPRGGRSGRAAIQARSMPFLTATPTGMPTASVMIRQPMLPTIFVMTTPFASLPATQYRSTHYRRGNRHVWPARVGWGHGEIRPIPASGHVVGRLPVRGAGRARRRREPGRGGAGPAARRPV